jgi:hypothetical protein
MEMTDDIDSCDNCDDDNQDIDSINNNQLGSWIQLQYDWLKTIDQIHSDIFNTLTKSTTNDDITTVYPLYPSTLLNINPIFAYSLQFGIKLIEQIKKRIIVISTTLNSIHHRKELILAEIKKNRPIKKVQHKKGRKGPKWFYKKKLSKKK